MNFQLSLRFQIVSDIHLECRQSKFSIVPIAPNLILAGDIDNIGRKIFEKFFNYCSENWQKVFYVLGNHEYYNFHGKSSFFDKNLLYRKFFEKYDNIILLDNSSYELLNNTVIIGTTLWSSPSTILNESHFKEFNKLNKKSFKKMGIDLETFKSLHRECCDFLKKEIAYYTDLNKKIIVITHFAPLLEETSSEIYKDQPPFMKEYFASDILKEVIPENIKYWIFGHTHYSTDFKYKNIRIVSNQVGYEDEGFKYIHKIISV